MLRSLLHGKESVDLWTQKVAPFELYEKEELVNLDRHKVDMKKYSLAQWILELGVLREQKRPHSPFEPLSVAEIEYYGRYEEAAQNLRKKRWIKLRKLIRKPEYADPQDGYGGRPLRYPWTGDPLKRTPLMLALGSMLSTDNIDDEGRRQIYFQMPTSQKEKTIVESRGELKQRFAFINALLSNVDVKSSLFVRDGANEFPDSTALDQVYGVIHLYLADSQVRRLYSSVFTKMLNIHSRMRPADGQAPKIAVDILCDWCCSEKAAYNCACCLQAKYCCRECQAADYELHNCLSS